MIDSASGNVIQPIIATGKKSYLVTLPEGVNAELIVVDNHELLTYLLVDGNVVTTP